MKLKNDFFISLLKLSFVIASELFVVMQIVIWLRLYLTTGNIDQSKIFLDLDYLILNAKIFFALWFFSLIFYLLRRDHMEN